jgi:hypothetical protein
VKLKLPARCSNLAPNCLLTGVDIKVGTVDIKLVTQNCVVFFIYSDVKNV